MTAAGSGSLPFQFANPQKIAGLVLRMPATSPMVRGEWYWEATPAAAMETIMVDHVSAGGGEEAGRCESGSKSAGQAAGGTVGRVSEATPR